MSGFGFREFQITTICVFVVSFVLHTTALSSAFWFKRRDIYGWLVHHGLWFMCDYYRTGGVDNKCFKLVNRYDNFENGDLQGVQTLMCLSLICNMVATAVFIPWMACGESRMTPARSKLLGLIGLSICIASGGLTLISITWFGIHYDKYRKVLNWSYILASIGGGILLLGGVLGLVVILRCNLSRASPKESPPSASSRSATTRPRQPIPMLTLPPLPSVEPARPTAMATANTSFETGSTATSIYDGDFEEKNAFGSVYEDDVFEKSQLAAIYGNDWNEKKQLVDLELNSKHVSNYAYTNTIV